MGERFWLLHISDLHITESSFDALHGKAAIRRYRRPRDLVERRSRPAALRLLKAVAQAAYLASPLDAILITGDLANWGESSALTAARNFVVARSVDGWHDAQGRPTLGRATVPVHLLPGNHDRYHGPGGVGIPGGALFDAVFQDHWNVGQGISFFVLGQSLGVVKADLTLSSMLHGTSLEGGLFGQGKAYVERVAFLKVQTELLRYKHPGIAVLWAVHFAPNFDGLDADLQLIDGGRLIEAAQEMNVDYLLCGHTHRHRSYPAGTGRPVTIHCVGSAAQEGEDSENTLNLFEVEVEGGSITRFVPTVLEYKGPAEGFWRRE